MATALPFSAYLESLAQLTPHADPTAVTSETQTIAEAFASLSALPDDALDVATLAQWVQQHPAWVPVLGLAVGLSQERLKNVLRDRFGSSGWTTLARTRSTSMVDWFQTEFDLLGVLTAQRHRTYDFGDILIARAGTRATAARAGVSGRRVEDEIEAVAHDLALPYRTRTRFTGRNGLTAPCDLVVPDDGDAQIVVAAKGFDSTGSKLTDAVREIQEMAAIRKPNQFVLAVIDGIGWKSRVADLRRIHGLWESGEIDGMYTLATLSTFRDDLSHAARLRGYL
ncbi:MAG: hypothetical protein P0Y48_04345 [Candidatus Microbacterium phytovorans]|uniref:Restriction endonuclease type II DpnII-like domain-containing protein n=1 Tax=Candidatus Microbacterium phytovorans TaxID=3121374 RepID=A0AAJ5W1M4_9MICO|nr:hypothetical protein [Microbacterium sp.]WEK14441.1 MAG: hypothetical protein P0Y48_04345 [Microbacterium sp.]